MYSIISRCWYSRNHEISIEKPADLVSGATAAVA